MSTTAALIEANASLQRDNALLHGELDLLHARQLVILSVLAELVSAAPNRDVLESRALAREAQIAASPRIRSTHAGASPHLGHTHARSVLFPIVE